MSATILDTTNKKEPIESLYKILEGISSWNTTDRFYVFFGMKNDIEITQNDLPKLLSYFNKCNRLQIFKSICPQQITSFNTLKCLKLFSGSKESYEALQHISPQNITSLTIDD